MMKHHGTYKNKPIINYTLLAHKLPTRTNKKQHGKNFSLNGKSAEIIIAVSCKKHEIANRNDRGQNVNKKIQKKI